MSTPKRLLVLTGTMMAALILPLGVGWIRSWRNSVRDVDVTSYSFVQALLENRTRRAYALTSTGFRHSITIDNLKAYEAQLAAPLGKVESIERKGSSVLHRWGSSEARVVFQVRGSMKTMELETISVLEGGEWRIQSCRNWTVFY